MINFSFFGIIFTYLLNICQNYFISVFSVFYFYIMCFIFGKILSASCLYILRGSNIYLLLCMHQYFP